MDIYPEGKNKAQVLDVLLDKYGDDVPLVFVGDRNVPGGNDWPLAQRIEEMHMAGTWFQVDSYKETQALIEHNKLFS